MPEWPRLTNERDIKESLLEPCGEIFFPLQEEACEKKISVGNTPLCPAFKQWCEDVISEQWQPSCDHEAAGMRKKSKILMMKEIKEKPPWF